MRGNEQAAGREKTRNTTGFTIEQWRIAAFLGVFILLASLVLFRYGALMLDPTFEEAVPVVRDLTERGSILDRNGRLLAMPMRQGNVTVWRPEITDLDTFCKELAPILEMNAADIKRRVTTSPTDFIYLKKRVEQETMKQVEALRKNLRGVNIETIAGRVYPEKTLASQILGFVGNEGFGLEGIEYAFENELTPQNGQNGNQVILTIDANIQYMLEDIAQEALTENNAEAVMLIAMEPRSGDLLGAASLPSFDPNNVKATSSSSLTYRPAIWAYEPGSVFKIFSLAALIDSGSVLENTFFTCNGRYQRVTNLGERVVINCLSSHGRVSAKEILTFSCNAGAAYASDRLESDAFYQSLRDFGFGSKIGAGNPGETAGLLAGPRQWSARSKPTIAMGQELAVSALQMMQAATAVANDGLLVQPRVVSTIRSDDGQTERLFEAGVPRRVLKSETARSIRSYMTDVTSETGIAWRANMDDLSMAVKTGTAQMIDPETNSYSETDYIASCIAMLPAESPSLILYMVIVKPQSGSYYGSRIAAPRIRQAAEALVNYLGIPRGKNQQVNHSGSVTLEELSPPQSTDKVPNFIGYSKRELMPLLLRDDLRIDLHGDGWVRFQSPAAGTHITKDTVITLELE
ncbi:MAG: transpeptidase family protein [Treponema sp.]|jgi:cell division protein FtsI (penicillin-binding protein 3)|nr:transpeptidase family protein [Treponema sp.]